MKKYFTKYIPVKGKIKEGDKFIADALSKDESPDICIAEPNVDLHLINNLKKYPKVELFLCSRDVSLHEECWLDNEKVIPNQLHVDLRDKCYKVIGSISSDAVWVNENDEFDEDEVTVQQVGPFHDMDDVFNVDNKVWNHTKTYKYYIQIKCSTCKHFH
jgi:hypothetical protein